MKTLITSLLIAITLSACGWHLRGSVQGSNTSIYSSKSVAVVINSPDDHGPLVTNLRAQFHNFNVTETDTIDAEAVQVNLTNLKLDKRAAGVGTDALVNVYELTLSVDYQITRDDITLTSPNTRATVTRTYNFEVSQANYSEQEEALIRREMHRELAQQILRRIKVLAAK